MIKLPEWFHWPRDIRIGRPAWYNILRFIIFVPLFFIGIVWTYIMIYLMYGSSDAKEFWCNV